ncbi:unnamed protein product [Urochloa humidicola]
MATGKWTSCGQRQRQRQRQAKAQRWRQPHRRIPLYGLQGVRHNAYEGTIVLVSGQRSSFQTASLPQAYAVVVRHQWLKTYRW